MRKVLIILLVILVGCSNDDSTPTEENTDKELVLDQTWETETASFLPQGLAADVNNRPYFYVAAKAGGLLIFEEPDTGSPNQIASIPIADLGNLHTTNIFQSGNYIYLSLGDFFGRNSKAGLAIVDVSDPKNPTITDQWESNEVLSGSAIVVVEGNYAYLGGMDHGLFIFDISNPMSILAFDTYLPDIKLSRGKSREYRPSKCSRNGRKRESSLSLQ